MDLWPHLRCPIYTTPFSGHFIKKRLIDYGLFMKKYVILYVN